MITVRPLPEAGRADFEADLQLIGQRLRDLRIEYGLSQRDLAELLGVNQSQVSEWETGKVLPLGTMARALALFGHMIVIDAVDLRGGVDDVD